MKESLKLSNNHTINVFGIPLIAWTMEQVLDAMEIMIQQKIPNYVITANLN